MVDNPIFVALIAIGTSIIASSGFWAFVQSRDKQKNARLKLLIGLTHELIVYLGVVYIDRGSITKDEFNNLMDKLYKPYLEIGGNGLVEKVVRDVGSLPIIEKERNDDRQPPS